MRTLFHYLLHPTPAEVLSRLRDRDLADIGLSRRYVPIYPAYAPFDVTNDRT